MVVTVQEEIARLSKEGKSHTQMRIELEAKGYSTDEIAQALSTSIDTRSVEDQKNARYLSIREVFDRIGYGGATPQFVNILFWLSQQANPFIIFIIGILNGLYAITSMVWSSVLQEYSKLNRVSKNTIATGGIVFGFSFLFMSFGILLKNIWVFSIFFIVSAIGLVAYGDLYHHFIHETMKKERMTPFLRSIAHWGVIITTIVLLITGFLLSTYPMSGTPFAFTILGKTFNTQIYGYLLAFEVTALSFIFAGYISSLLIDKREEQHYSFTKFLKEYWNLIKQKVSLLQHNKYAVILALATVINGVLQVLITAYSGIAIYQLFAKQYPAPFFTLAMIYAIAILASFTGPYFTQKIHSSTGLAPTMVFGTMLTAILPLVIVFNANIAAITAALCMYVIGGAVVGYAQGLLTHKIMREETRKDYFHIQPLLITPAYLICIPLLAFLANKTMLSTMFIVVAAGIIFLVMPLYFILVLISQKIKL